MFGIEKVSQFVAIERVERKRQVRFQDNCQKLAGILFESAVVMGRTWGGDGSYARWAEGLTPEDPDEKRIRIEATPRRWNASSTDAPPSIAFLDYKILVYSYNREAVEGGGVNITINEYPDEIVHLEFYDCSTKWLLRRKTGFRGSFSSYISDPEYVQR